MLDYLWDTSDTDPNTDTTPDHAFERASVSPHVNQFMVDYMFVHDKLISACINPLVDMGMGDGDLALSIVNDAYNQKSMADQIDNEIQVKNCIVSVGA